MWMFSAALAGDRTGRFESRNRVPRCAWTDYSSLAALRGLPRPLCCGEDKDGKLLSAQGQTRDRCIPRRDTVSVVE